MFNNNLLDLKFNKNDNFTINYIIYIINSDFSCFYEYYNNIKSISITDVFLERLTLSKTQKMELFSSKFKNLFWLKLNNIPFDVEDYDGLISFIYSNSLDLNRLFIENIYLNDLFFKKFINLNGFGNLTFVNFDNSNISDVGLGYFVSFLVNNKIDLEYFSLINNKVKYFNELFNYLSKSNIRILDLSSSLNLDINLLITFIINSDSIKELYLRNIILSDSEIEKIYNIFLNNKSKIYNLRFSLTKNQENYLSLFNELGFKNNINFDINFIGDSPINLFSTIYIKGTSDYKLKQLENEYFYFIDENSIENDFNLILKEKSIYLKDCINLFLFDFNDYKKIDFLLKNYDFNYIYIENYYISDEDFIFFINSIGNQRHKRYKINFISIEISEFQLDYLINNFPENIFYIEVNLNKISNNRELYISKILKNEAFIFENMELYKKIFK